MVRLCYGDVFNVRHFFYLRPSHIFMMFCIYVGGKALSLFGGGPKEACWTWNIPGEDKDKRKLFIFPSNVVHPNSTPREKTTGWQVARDPPLLTSTPTRPLTTTGSWSQRCWTGSRSFPPTWGALRPSQASPGTWSRTGSCQVRSTCQLPSGLDNWTAFQNCTALTLLYDSSKGVNMKIKKYHWTQSCVCTKIV